ncbi:MAG: tungstate ABC transporter substrate-binding protein WtpA [Candidatus Helarchaeota archaeon]
MSLKISWFSRHKIKILAIVLGIVLTGSIIGSIFWITQEQSKTALYCYHAGSLTVPFATYASMWQTLNPTYIIYNSPHGSATAIRQLTENGKPTDLIGSADYSLIISMMMEVQVPGQNYNYSDWYIITCRNAMVIAYITANSPPWLDNLTRDTSPQKWYEILNRTDVTIGRADPYQDPCGYRTLMVWGLADEYQYGLLNNQWDSNIINQSFYDKDPITGHSGEGTNLVKSKETDLISSLQAGEIDYLFIYRSIAKQHGLNYLSLDDHLDLSNESLSDFYANVTVNRKSPIIPGAQSSDIAAKPIVYGITIPNTAPHPEAAIQYVKFMLGSPGVWIDNYQEPVWPYLTNNVSLLPTQLQPYCINDPNYP